MHPGAKAEHVNLFHAVLLPILPSALRALCSRRHRGRLSPYALHGAVDFSEKISTENILILLVPRLPTFEFLECSCGNNVSADGFEELPQSCENPHYKCGSCGAFACVDYDFRIVNNIDKAQ